MDAEKVHEKASALIQATPAALLQKLAGSEICENQTTVFDLEFLNPVGLAAGFDKNCELIEKLPYFGFGFAEIGTVTELPQSGNPRPRLFRQATDLSLFNCLGFNNDGAATVSKRLERSKHKLPQKFRVGVNIGKNKEVSQDSAAQNYSRCLSYFEGMADYITINVSSPNTEGLRSLQEVEPLKKILQSIFDVRAKWKDCPPVLVKFAPEVDERGLTEKLPALEEFGVAGFVLTNTIAGEHRGKKGGWSGQPLRYLSRSRLESARAITQSPIISVGGIVNEQEALSRFKSGADLIQFYSAWVFQGPNFPTRLVKALSAAELPSR